MLFLLNLSLGLKVFLWLGWFCCVHLLGWNISHSRIEVITLRISQNEILGRKHGLGYLREKLFSLCEKYSGVENFRSLIRVMPIPVVARSKA